jgi:PAS domain-containing protein
MNSPESQPAHDTNLSGELELKFLNLILKASSIGVWYWDLTNNKITLNEQAHNIFGINIDEFDGSFDDFMAFIHPEDLHRVSLQLNSILNSSSSYSMDFKIIKLNQEVAHLRSRGAVYKNPLGKPAKIINIVWNIGKEKLIQEKLLEASLYKEAILNSADCEMAVDFTPNSGGTLQAMAHVLYNYTKH